MITLKIQELAYALLRRITGHCRVCGRALHPKDEQICSAACEIKQQEIDVQEQSTKNYYYELSN
jgi:hypothetical protein